MKQLFRIPTTIDLHGFLEKRTRHLLFFIIGLGIIMVCFLYLLSVSWFRWGELIIDTSRELWVPSQILEGRVIYKDLDYPYGFFPPYFLAYLYMLFGVRIESLVLCGIIITILMSLLLYKISRLFLNKMFSGLVVLTFLFVLAFGFYCSNGIFNFILPYSFASTFFILFLSSALYSFLKFIFTEQKQYLLLYNIFLSFAFFSRPELSLSIWIVFVLIGWIFYINNRNKDSRAILLYIVSPLFISTCVYILFLYTNNAFAGFKESIIDCIKINSKNPLGIRWMGLEHVFLNGLEITKSFLLHLLIISILGIASLILSLSFLKKKRSFIEFGTGLILLFFTFLFSANYLLPYLQYKSVTLILLIGSLLFLIKIIRTSNKLDREALSLLTLFLVSLLTILRIFFDPHPFNYGFYLLALSLICYYVFFLRIFKPFLESHIKMNSRVFSAILIIFFIFQITHYWKMSSYLYSKKTLKVITDKGIIFHFYNDRTLKFWSAVDYLKKNTLKNATVAVFPEGVSINFFTGRKNPLRYYTFLPPGIKTAGEEKMISELSKASIDYIVILSRDTTEYGYPAFGIDYAKKIFSWIQDNYEIITQFGPFPFTTPEFGIALFKRKAS